MSPVLKPKIYSPDEYLEQEVISETRHEYRDGLIVPITGGTPDHNEIALNLATLLKIALRGQAFRIFGSDQRLWIQKRQMYIYPDVLVVAKPLELQQGRKDTITNPVLIAEVLSKSTQDYDHGEKFSAYRTLPSFTEYLLINQYNIQVEHYLRTASNQWLLTEYTQSTHNIMLKSLDVEVQVQDLYENIEFAEI